MKWVSNNINSKNLWYRYVFARDIENFDKDFLVGLGCIKKFHLEQNDILEGKKIIFLIIKKLGLPQTMVKLKKLMNINLNEHLEVQNFNVTINYLDTQQQYEINR